METLHELPEIESLRISSTVYERIDLNIGQNIQISFLCSETRREETPNIALTHIVLYVHIVLIIVKFCIK